MIVHNDDDTYGKIMFEQSSSSHATYIKSITKQVLSDIPLKIRIFFNTYSDYITLKSRF